MQIHRTTNFVPVNKQAFGIKLEIADNSTKNALEKNLKDYYSSCSPMIMKQSFQNKEFNFKAIFDSLKKSFEQLTYTDNDKALNETVAIIKSTETPKGTGFNIDYIDNNKKLVELKENLDPSVLLQDELLDKGVPYLNASSTIVSDIEDAIGHNGENKISKLTDKLFDMQMT